MKNTIEEAVRQILDAVGENPQREGLVGTPERIARMYDELLAGYQQDPRELLRAQFDQEKYDQMILLSGITFTSLCEHHMLPFVGQAAVGYLPAGRVLGISKLARLVDIYARRLQIQERMTHQIAEFLMRELAPLGVGVLIRARHACMGLRGAKKPEAWMTTSALIGSFRQPEVRAEFFQLAAIDRGIN